MTLEEKQLCYDNLLIEPVNPIFSQPLIEFDEKTYLSIYLYICTNHEIIKYIHKNSVAFIDKLRAFHLDVDSNIDIFKQLISYIRKIHGKESTAIHQFIALSSL